MTKMCTVCGGEIYEFQDEITANQHDDIDNCLAAALGRVEAAEAEAAEWKTAYANNELYGLALMQRRDELEARAQASIAVIDSLRDKVADSERTKDALAGRVAELEAASDAQGWRPVTEDWPPHGVQHLGRAMLNSPTLLITRTVYEGDEVWQDDDGLLFYGGEIRYCAAIPPAAAEATE